MSNDRRHDLLDDNMFRGYAGNDRAVIPEGATGPLDTRTAAEFEADRLSHMDMSSARSVFRTRRDVCSPEVAEHISRQLSAQQPVLVLGPESRVE